MLGLRPIGGRPIGGVFVVESGGATLFMSITEETSFGDEQSHWADVVIGLAETFDGGDGQSQAASLVQALSDLANLGELFQLRSVAGLLGSEALVAVGNTTFRGIVRQVTFDAAALTDGVVTVGALAAAIVEQLEPSDVVSLSANLAVGLVEDLEFVDSPDLTLAAAVSMVVSDLLSTGDTASTTGAIRALIRASIRMDAVVGLRGLVMASLSDDLHITDLTSITETAIALLVEDAIAITEDAAGFRIDGILEASDALGLSENLTSVITLYQMLVSQGWTVRDSLTMTIPSVGVVSISFTLKQAAASFAAKQAGISFTQKQASAGFNVKQAGADFEQKTVTVAFTLKGGTQ